MSTNTSYGRLSEHITSLVVRILSGKKNAKLIQRNLVIESTLDVLSGRIVIIAQFRTLSDPPAKRDMSCNQDASTQEIYDISSQLAIWALLAAEPLFENNAGDNVIYNNTFQDYSNHDIKLSSSDKGYHG